MSAGVGLPALPCDGKKCQVCGPSEKKQVNLHVSSSEHAHLKAESRRMGVTLTGYLRILIRDDMRAHGKKP